jgi:hypothetical protein
VSNTNITNVEITDTFQVWINKTNEVVDLINENVLLAGPGAGFTVEGNSTLIGSFTANTISSNTTETDLILLETMERKGDISTPILSTSPIRISSNVENIFTARSTTGNRPIVRLINGADLSWALGHATSSASAPFTIRLEGGDSNPQFTLTTGGRLTVNELEGDGSRIVAINASNISTGTFSADRIPNLDASKITTGTFADARIPNLSASKITGGVFDVARIPDLNANKITAGTFADARIPNLNASKITTGIFSADRIPNLDASKITTGTVADARLPSNIVRDSRRLVQGPGITISGNGDLSTDRTISAAQLTEAQATNPNSTVFGAVSGQRISQASTSNTNSMFNVSGSAPLFAIRAWGFVSGGNLVSGGNVQSYNSGNGIVTLNIPMQNNNYAAVVQLNARGGVDVTDKTASSFRVTGWSSGGNFVGYNTTFHFVVIG